MSFPVFDFHCDTATELLGRDLSGSTSLRSNKLHIDLERGRTLGGYAQCFAFWCTTDLPLPKGIKMEDVFWREVSVLQDAIDKNSDWIRQARTPADIRANLDAGLISAIFNWKALPALALSLPNWKSSIISVSEYLHWAGMRRTASPAPM